MTTSEILLTIQKKIFELRKKNGMIDSQIVLAIIDDALHTIQNKAQSPKKLLFVEDGSVDIDELEMELTDPDTRVVVYRQGSRMPELMNVSNDKEE